MTSPSNHKIQRDDVRLSELHSSPATTRTLTRSHAVISIALVLAIVAGAWLVGGRIGLADIGSGGVSRQYLPKVGEKAPALGMYDSDGKTVFLSGFQGQPVWINFWGSWCPPCQAEFPDIEAAYQALEPQGVVLLAISMRESWETANAFAVSQGGTFPVYNIPDPTIFSQTWDVRNFPTHMYIDADGIVRNVSIKPSKADELIANGEWLLAGSWDIAKTLPITVELVAIKPDDGHGRGATRTEALGRSYD